MQKILFSFAGPASELLPAIKQALCPMGLCAGSNVVPIATGFGRKEMVDCPHLVLSIHHHGTEIS